jgi:hypothetical protein
MGHELRASSVKLAQPIKQLDNVMVDVVLAESITTQVKVWVVRSGEGAADGEQTDASDQDDGTETYDDDDGV